MNDAWLEAQQRYLEARRRYWRAYERKLAWRLFVASVVIVGALHLLKWSL